MLNLLPALELTPVKIHSNSVCTETSKTLLDPGFSLVFCYPFHLCVNLMFTFLLVWAVGFTVIVDTVQPTVERSTVIWSRGNFFCHWCIFHLFVPFLLNLGDLSLLLSQKLVKKEFFTFCICG